VTAKQFVQEYLKFYYDSVVMKREDIHERFDDLAEIALQIIDNEKH
jgi:hypothetical protein